MKWFVPIVLCLSLLIGGTGGSEAAEPTDLGKNGSWNAHSLDEQGGKLCYMSSLPTKSEGKYQNRGDTVAVVTHDTAKKHRGTVSFIMGYTLKAGSEVTVTIGRAKFTLTLLKGETAWASDADDPKLVKAIHGGSKMIVEGVSSRGTKTKDTYSLQGATAAYKAISKACGVK